MAVRADRAAPAGRGRAEVVRSRPAAPPVDWLTDRQAGVDTNLTRWNGEGRPADWGEMERGEGAMEERVGLGLVDGRAGCRGYRSERPTRPAAVPHQSHRRRAVPVYESRSLLEGRERTVAYRPAWYSVRAAPLHSIRRPGDAPHANETTQAA